MMTICVDSGFLIALYDQSDGHHKQAKQYFSTYFENTVNRLLIPWPILYEAVSTRMVRGRGWIVAIERDWKILRQRNRLDFLPDQEFRQTAMDGCLAEIERPPQHYRALSLVDRVVRGILAQVNVRLDLFITFNPKDFIDVCTRAHRAILA